MTTHQQWHEEHPGYACEYSAGRFLANGCIGETLYSSEPEPPRTLTQDELLTQLDELLDRALHGPECFIDPDDTLCHCVIGKVRAALPPCPEYAMSPGGRPYKCHRNAHPASPDRHVF